VPWEHLSCRVRSSFPEQGVTCHILLHSAEVCPSKRDQSLVAQLSCMLVHTSLVWGPVIDPSQSQPSSHNACPPNSRKQVVPPIFTPNDEVPRRPLWTIIDTSAMRTEVSHPCASSPARSTATGNWLPIDMRTREDTANFPVPFQVSWMTRFLRCWNNYGIGSYS
jgi:hypothetical protein